MNHYKRKALPLNPIQISFINGCSKLQNAVWKFCSRDPLNALQSKISLLIRQAIKYLMNAREKLRKQVLKSMIQKWLNNAHLMSISNLRRNQILKSRINKIDSYRRLILSNDMKNSRIKQENLNLDFPGQADESSSSKKSKERIRDYSKTCYYRTKGITSSVCRWNSSISFFDLFEKSIKNMKSRAFKYWRNIVKYMNDQIKKKQLLLKNIVKSIIVKNNTTKKNILNKWRYIALEFRIENENFMLCRGLLTLSLYNKWHKINLLNALSCAFNEWRRNIKKKSINYKVKLKRLVILADKKQNLILAKVLEKWNKLAKILSHLKNRKDAILRGRIKKIELYKNMMLAHKFNIWRVSAFKEDDLIKTGAMFRFLYLLINKALNPIRVDFMNELYNHRNINYYKKALPRMIYLNKRCQNLMKRKALNKWKRNADFTKINSFHRNLLLKDIIRKKQSNINNIVRKLINKWYKNSNHIKNDIDKTLLHKGLTIFTLYNKWNKINKMNTLDSFFNIWRRKSSIEPFYFEKLFIEINAHLLKLNIMKNGEEFLNNLKALHYYANRQYILKKSIEKADKIKQIILKNTLRKWYKNSLKVGRNNKYLEKILINNDFRMNNLMEKLLRKSLYNWHRNAIQSKKDLLHSKKACDLLRKTTTEPFFSKIREKINKKIVEDKFKSIMTLILRKREKNYLRDYINLWRIITRKLRAYNMNIIFLNNIWKNREKLYKFRIMYYLKEKANLINIKLDNSRRLLSCLVNRLDSLNKVCDKEILGRYLYKWKENTCLMRNSFKIINSYIEGILVLKKFSLKTAHPDLLNALDNSLREKPLHNIQNKWKYLSHRLLSHQISVLLKFAKINKVIYKINKRNFFEKFRELAFFRYLNDLLTYLFSKYDFNAKKYILGKRFNDWVEQTRRLTEYEDSMALRIQNSYKNYIDNQKKLHNIQLQILLKKFIGKIISKSKLSLSSAFYRWSKNIRLLRSNYNSTLIQNFCSNIKNVLKFMVWKKRLKRIEKGIEIFDSSKFGLRYAYNKLIENSRNIALYRLTYLLQEKVHNRRRQVVDKFIEQNKAFVLNRLLSFRKNYIDNILYKILNQWEENAFEIRERIELEEDRKNRIYELLKIILNIYGNDKMFIFKKNLYKWRDKAKEMKIQAYSRIIAKNFKNKYRISKARTNWSNLSRHLRNNKYSEETRDIIVNIKRLIGLQSFIDDLTGKIKLDGLNQIKQGLSWITVIEFMNY